MSTIYTQRQLRFIHVFMHQIHPMLKSFLKIDAVDADSGYAIADGLSNGANALSAAVAVAGLAAAAPTLGTSLAGASGCIVLLQTLNGGFQFVKRHLDHQDEPFSPDETKLSETYLSLNILLRQVAYLATVRYRHVIDEILDEHSVATYASYVASRAMKHLTLNLAQKERLDPELDAETFLDYFMAKATLPIIHKSPRIALKEEYTRSGSCSPQLSYAKLACSRPGLAVYDDPHPGQYVLYVSPRSNLLSTDLTTLQDEYGFATVPPSELASETAAVNRKKLIPLSPGSRERALNRTKHHFATYHEVTVKEVLEYLSEIRMPTTTTGPVKSFNQYLSECSTNNLIAACNDGRLRGLDLSGGNFSEVWFVGKVDLSGCDLSHSIWTKAHLNGAHFERNNLSGVNFQHAYIEQSSWENIQFSGDFSHAKLNGSKLINSTITAEFNQFGCDWELVEMENVRKEDALQLLTLRLNEQLARQNEERVKLNDQITHLSQQYTSCLQQTIHASAHTAKDDEDLVVLRGQIEALERQHAQNISQMNTRLMSIRSQFSRLKNDHIKQAAVHDEAMSKMSERLEKLERRAHWASPKHISGMSFFSRPKQREDKPSPSHQEASDAHSSLRRTTPVLLGSN